MLSCNLLEVFMNTVLYQRHIYPDGIFKKRRAFGTFTYVPIFPPLVTYLKRILEACAELIKDGTLDTLELSFFYRNEELECHEFKMSKIQLDMEEHAFEIEERIKDLLIKLETKFQTLKPLPEDTTFRINIHTTLGSLKNINDNIKCQDFPWIRNGEGNQFNEELLYNPVCLDKSLGVDISVNQKVDLILL